MDVRDNRHRFRRRILVSLGQIIVSFTFVLAPSPASAQDIAAAEALFNKGVEEIKAGNFKDACPAIAESQKLDPRPGTQYTLAECYARWGKTATAYVTFEDFLRTVNALPNSQRARYADRVKNSESKKVELKPNIPELTIRLPNGAPAGLRITRDNLEITPPMLGLSLPVDPGPHKVVVELNGKPPAELDISLSPGERKTLEVPVPGMQKKAPDTDNGKPGKGRVVATYATLGIGAAGVILGGVTGGLALSEKHKADHECPDFNCTPAGLDSVQNGRSLARVSTIGFAVGGAGLAAGLILFLTRPKQPAPVTTDVAVGRDGVALTLKGVWQ